MLLVCSHFLDLNECRGIYGTFSERKLSEYWEESMSASYNWWGRSQCQSLGDWETHLFNGQFLSSSSSSSCTHTHKNYSTYIQIIANFDSSSFVK